MPSNRKQGYQDQTGSPVRIDEGTMCRAESQPPGLPWLDPAYNRHPLLSAPGARMNAGLMESNSKQDVDLLDSIYAAISGTFDGPKLLALAERYLGPASFSAGVATGVGLELINSAVELLEMLGMLILADLHDRFSYWLGSTAVGKHLAEAADKRAALIAAVKAIFSSPGEFFDAVKGDYVARWNRFEKLMGESALASRFEAGKIFGGFLLEIAGLLATGAAAAKLAAKVPQLAKLLPKLRVRSGRPRTAVEAAPEGKTAKKVVAATGTESAVGNLTEFQRIMKQVETLDVSTPKNGAVFYSGPGNRAVGEAFASKTGKLTLERTPGGKMLDDMKLYDADSPLTAAEADAAWARLSQRYAQQASGEVTAFVEGARPDRIFMSVEKPALESNPNVTSIKMGGK